MRMVGSVIPSMAQTKSRLVRATCCTSQPSSSSASNIERFLAFRVWSQEKRWQETDLQR
jgi:hypothetical protein